MLTFLAFLISNSLAPTVVKHTCGSEQRKGNWLYCTFSFWDLFLFYKQHGRCILCLVILVGGCFFLFQGGGPAKPFRENVGPEDILDGKSDLQPLEEKKPNSVSPWENSQVGKETYLNFHSSSPLQRKVPTRAPWPNQPRAWKPSSWALGMSTKPDCDQPGRHLISERRYLTTKQNFCFLHCQGLPTR